MTLSRTEKARKLLARQAFTSAEIAKAVGLHPAYVRKINQRDRDADGAWQSWRDRNPKIVLEYRNAQNMKRKLARAKARAAKARKASKR